MYLWNRNRDIFGSDAGDSVEVTIFYQLWYHFFFKYIRSVQFALFADTRIHYPMPAHKCRAYASLFVLMHFDHFSELLHICFSLPCWRRINQIIDIIWSIRCEQKLEQYLPKNDMEIGDLFSIYKRIKMKLLHYIRNSIFYCTNTLYNRNTHTNTLTHLHTFIVQHEWRVNENRVMKICITKFHVYVDFLACKQKIVSK